MIKEKLKLVTEKFSESWAACMCMMVQGDLSVLTLNHALTASKVGILTGVAILVASFLPWNNKWLGIFLTGAFTALADSLVHMAMFPYESLATGAGAMLLAIVFEKTFKKNL